MSTLTPPPVLDARTYQELRDEALARIPIHNPEWTNFNRADPGVTLLELFAFLTESLLYRANQIPERNRRAFLSLLGVPLQPATSARGVVSFSLEGGPPRALTLNADVELRAGQIPFRTEAALDVLPVEALVYYKRPLPDVPAEVREHYGALYASFTGATPDPDSLDLYETVPLEPAPAEGVDLVACADKSLWIALLVRRADATSDVAAARAELREVLAGKTLSLGIVPVLADPEARLSPLGRSATEAGARLDYQVPRVAPTGALAGDPGRIPHYRSLDARANANVLDATGIVQLTLPGADGLRLWDDIDPLEAGAGELPPALEDTRLADRVITWLRIRASHGAQAQLLWAGINAVTVTQQARAAREVLPDGLGQPDQAVRLAHSPVLPETLSLRVDGVPWSRVDDLYGAPPEVPVPDLRLPPGAPPPPAGDPRVYTVDPASGVVRFGDGVHGARPPAGAPIRADYAYAAGRAGNVEAGAIRAGAALPAGVKVANPVRTWGGAEAETVAEGEKQILRYLRHRDRLVSGEDFDTIVRRTPGVDVGRVDVIPAFNPELSPSAPGDVPGAVTLLVLPRSDRDNRDAPLPDQPFLDAICAYIDPRRLVTTECFLRGPDYQPIWLSVAVDIVAGVSTAEARDAVRDALRGFLSPLPVPAGAFAHAATGWPRGKPVVPLELLAVAARVPAVELVRGVLLAAGDGPGSASEPVRMSGLQLPRLAGLSVVVGADPLPLDELRGSAPPSAPVPKKVVPVPIIPESC
jgi:Baseplate J-like protein